MWAYCALAAFITGRTKFLMLSDLLGTRGLAPRKGVVALGCQYRVGLADLYCALFDVVMIPAIIPFLFALIVAIGTLVCFLGSGFRCAVWQSVAKYLLSRLNL